MQRGSLRHDATSEEPILLLNVKVHGRRFNSYLNVARDVNMDII